LEEKSNKEIGAGNNTMVGMTVAVAIEEANR
jgi:hypothetical protein